MGQYYQLCNIDKRQRLHPHDLGDGLKLMEFGMSSGGAMTALAGLLVLDVQQRGPWAGDRIVIAGDYADEGRFVPPEFSKSNLYSYATGYAKPDSAVKSDATEAADDPQDDAEDDSEAAPEYESLTDKAVAQVQGLGLDFSLRKAWGSSESHPVSALENPARVYDQPEDLFEAFGLSPVEVLSSVVEGITCELRMNAVKSPLAWDSVSDVAMELDLDTGRALNLKVCFVSRDGNLHKERTLAFPATAADVCRWLQVPSAVPALPGEGQPRLTQN